MPVARFGQKRSLEIGGSPWDGAAGFVGGGGGAVRPLGAALRPGVTFAGGAAALGLDGGAGADGAADADADADATGGGGGGAAKATDAA